MPGDGQENCFKNEIPSGHWETWAASRDKALNAAGLCPHPRAEASRCSAGKPETAARFQGIYGLSVRTMLSRGDKGLTSRVLPAGRVKSDPSCDVTVRAWRSSGARGGRAAQGESRLTREGVWVLFVLKVFCPRPQTPEEVKDRPRSRIALPGGSSRGLRLPPGLPQQDPSRPSGKNPFLRD